MKELKPIKRRKRSEAKNQGRVESCPEPDREKTQASFTRKETGGKEPEKENQRTRMPEIDLPEIKLPETPLEIESEFESPVAEMTRAEVPMELLLVNPNESPSKINAVPNDALKKAGKKRRGANDVETKVFYRHCRTFSAAS